MLANGVPSVTKSPSSMLYFIFCDVGTVGAVFLGRIWRNRMEFWQAFPFLPKSWLNSTQNRNKEYVYIKMTYFCLASKMNINRLNHVYFGPRPNQSRSNVCFHFNNPSEIWEHIDVSVLMHWISVYWHELNLIPAWISNHMVSKVWDEIPYPPPNFNNCTIEVWEWIRNFIPHFIMYFIFIIGSGNGLLRWLGPE